jgi:hypothetical protein
MAQPAATKGDRIVAIDLHLIQPPGPVSPVTVPHPFSGVIDSGVSTDVLINGSGAALQDSGATNTPSHVPIGGSFVTCSSTGSRPRGRVIQRRHATTRWTSRSAGSSPYVRC